MALTRPQNVIEWRKPPQSFATSIFSGFKALFAAPPAPATLRAAIKSIGLPRIPNTTPEQELVILSGYAAEVEHGLMVQYLYASYAASQTAGAAKAVLLSIAIQEMGHLLTVQNLLIAAGAEPYLGRYDWSASIHFSPFRLALEPLSIKVLAKYAACEMPECALVDEEERDILDALLADARDSAGMQPTRIGLLYAKLYWLVHETDFPEPDPAQEPWPDFPFAEIASIPEEAGRHVAALPAGTPRGWQAHGEDWEGDGHGVIVSPISSRPEALAALTAVAAQGEGFGTEEDAHFDRFVALYRSLAGVAGLSRAVPLDPWYPGGTGSGDAASSIDEPVAALLAALGDDLYELILLGILLYHQLPDQSQRERRGQVAHAALDCMRRGMGPLARLLVQRPRHPGVQADVAAAHLCFLPPARDLPDDYAALRRRTKEAGVVALARIAQIDVPATPAPIKSTVRDVRNRALAPLMNVIDTLPESL